MYEHIILLLTQESDLAFISTIEKHVKSQYEFKVSTLLFSKFDLPDPKALYLLYLCDQEIKILLKHSHISTMQMGIIPNDRSAYAIRCYGISKDAIEAVDNILGFSDPVCVDILMCNGTPVLGNIIIGNVHGMNKLSHGLSAYLRIKAFFSDIVNLGFQSYCITTAKGNVTNTAATGIMIFEHNLSGTSHNLLYENLSMHDGRLHALILAPSSTVSYLYYLFLSYFLNRLLIEKLPESIGLIVSAKLKITSPVPIEYMADGEVYKEPELLLEVVRDSAYMYLGKEISDLGIETVQEEEKETVRTKGLPKSEMSKLLVNEPVPFLPKAEEEDFRDLFIDLRQNAKLSSVFVVLMVLSTLLATTGLFQNSTPVIIGAMVLAPFMSPIVSFSMGALRGEKELIKESSLTLVTGILMALVFSCLYTYFIPLNLATNEMRSRLNPNILDLMVAIISGAAGAYAHAKSEVAKSLAGVAIAVALVPPLSVTGIGIGWGDSQIIYGSFLLFLTNLAGITLSAALTFLILGYAPIYRATKGIIFTSFFLILITIPLVFSFSKVIEQNNIFMQLKEMRHLTIDNQIIRVRTLSVDLSQGIPVVYIETRSNTILNDNQLQSIKTQIDITLKRTVTVNILSEVELDSTPK